MALYQEAGLSHIQLCDGDEVKALAVYKENRGGRCNFVELKCVHTVQQDHKLEGHMIRNTKDHLSNLRYSYILSQIHADFVPKYNALDFFAIEYDLLPVDVKERMPQKAGTVCMKFLLPNWQKNRYDLVHKPVGYPPSVAGDALRECIRQAKSRP